TPSASTIPATTTSGARRGRRDYFQEHLGDRSARCRSGLQLRVRGEAALPPLPPLVQLPRVRRTKGHQASEAEVGMPRLPPGSKRYRLRVASWTVVRESDNLSPRMLTEPAAVARLAEDLLQATDDDKEHFWVVLLNAQNHYLMHTEVSAGSQSASIVHP